MTIAELRIAALAEYLGCDAEELSEEGDETRISRGRDEYLVLTDAEADDASLHDGKENRIVRDHVELFIYRQ